MEHQFTTILAWPRTSSTPLIHRLSSHCFAFFSVASSKFQGTCLEVHPNPAVDGGYIFCLVRASVVNERWHDCLSAVALLRSYTCINPERSDLNEEQHQHCLLRELPRLLHYCLLGASGVRHPQGYKLQAHLSLANLMQSYFLFLMQLHIHATCL
jgi:hypothetical protein